MESVDKVCLIDTTVIRWGTYKYNNTQLSISVQKTPHELCNTYSSSIMRLIPGHLRQHCPVGGGRGLVQGGRAHSTSLQSMGCGMKTACRCVVRNINDYG